VAASKALRLPAHRESPSRRAVALLQEYRVTADPVAWRQFRSLVEPGKVEPRVLDALQTAAFALPDVSEERQAEEESVRRQLAFGLILTEPTFLEQLGQTGRTALAEAALQALGTDGTPVGRLNATRFLWAARAELSAA
jgi:hypothetical protein